MKITTEVTQRVYDELTSHALVVYIFIIAWGALGAVGCGLAYGFWGHDFTWIVLTIAFGAIFFGGFALIFMQKKNVNKNLKTAITTEITFFEDGFFNVTYRNGEKAEEAKVYFRDVAFYRETKHYFLFFLHKTSVLPVEKGENEAELRAIVEGSGIKRKKI